MKFNFKKITSVLASAVMLGSTIGIAAAATYPAPFIVGGAADVTVVVGAASPNNVDYIAATDLGSSLSTELASQATGTGETTAIGGDSIKVEKATNKLNMNDALTDIWTTKITNSHLPDLLADATFRSKDNVDYTYEQYITLYNTLNFTHFDDDDYKKDTPSLGIRLPSSTKVLNYTLDFKKYPRSDVVSGRLEDIEDRDIVILGNTYKLLNAYNASTDTKFELMRGAVTDTINLNEEKTAIIDGNTYTVTLTYVDVTYTQFDVVDSEGNSQTTTKLAKGGTYKLSDGTQLGVTDISYQAFSGGVMAAEFTLGANKLTIENGAVLEMDDEDVNEITCYITDSYVSAAKRDINKIILEWETDDEEYVAPGSTLILPGFESVKLSYGGFVTDCEETVTVKAKGSYGIEIEVPIKDGDAKFTILQGNATDFYYISDDSDGTGKLRTSKLVAGNNITFDRNTDDYFIASWNDSTSADSYMLRVTSITEDTSVKENYTTIENYLTGTAYSNKKREDVITIGNIELTLGAIHKADKTVDIEINTDGTFNRIYTTGGLGIWLPVNASHDEVGTCRNTPGVIFNNTDILAPSFTLMMSEEDKDGKLGAGGIINLTLDQSSSEAQVTEVTANAGGDAGGMWSSTTYKEVGDTDDYEGYVASDLATRILFKKPTSAQNNVEIIYHCSQAYADVYITAEETVITATDGAEIGTITYYDNELTSAAKGKNLIVVGGSCINTVAAELLGGSLCAADFTAETSVGADQFLVQVFNNPYTSGKVAMLVAGYEAADTKKAVTYVTMESPATAVGTVLKKVTATYADVA